MNGSCLTGGRGRAREEADGGESRGHVLLGALARRDGSGGAPGVLFRAIATRMTLRDEGGVIA